MTPKNPQNNGDTEDREKQFNQTLNESARLLRANRPGEALKKLQTLYQEHPTDPDVAINLGGAYILQRKWSRAVKVLEAATQHSPDNAMLWMNLGAAYLGRLKTAGPKQQKQAIFAYEKALQVDPEIPNAHYHLGLIHKERGKLNQASAHFQRALEVNPADKDARYWLDQLGRIMAEQQSQRSQGEDGENQSEHPAENTDDDPEEKR